MSSYEPYVAEPAEHPPSPRLGNRRIAIGTAAVAVVVAALTWATVDNFAEQDPALEVPFDQIEQPGPADESDDSLLD